MEFLEGKEKGTAQFWFFANPHIKFHRSPRWQNQKYM